MPTLSELVTASATSCRLVEACGSDESESGSEAIKFESVKGESETVKCSAEDTSVDRKFEDHCDSPEDKTTVSAECKVNEGKTEDAESVIGEEECKIVDATDPIEPSKCSSGGKVLSKFVVKLCKIVVKVVLVKKVMKSLCGRWLLSL